MNKLVKSNTWQDESLEKRNLERTISVKEKLLVTVIEKIEQLKIDLFVLKQEYDIKIRRLYLRLDELDLEISKFKKVEDLINSGISIEEAQKKAGDTLKERRKQVEEEYKKFNEEVKVIEKRKTISNEEQEELKKLFRELVLKFHPDLPTGNEDIMKKINKAYAEGDIEALRAFNQSKTCVDVKNQTIEVLKKKLAELEKSIEAFTYELEKLRLSEWSTLKENIKKAKDQRRDILNELEEKLLTDIAMKENLLTILRNKYD